MQPQLVSIIIPLYNAEKYITATLDSLLDQSHPRIEIIVVDDGSSDGSQEILKTYSDKRIKIVSQRNSGAAVARNTGLKHSKGEFIQFMDADDLLAPEKIELQLAALNNYPDKLAVGNYIEFFDNEDIDKKSVPENQQGFIYSTDAPADFLLNLWGANGSSNFIQTNSWLVPRNLIDLAGRWRNYRCPDDDGEFFTRVLLASKGIVYVPEALNYYRRFLSEGNLSNHRSYHALKNSLLTIELKKKYIESHLKSEKINQAFARQFMNFSVYNYLNNRFLSRLSERKYKALGVRVEPPVIGGKVIQLLAKVFGWKFASRLKQCMTANS